MRNKGQDQPIDLCTGCPLNPSPAVSGSDANTEKRSKLTAIPLSWDQRSAGNPRCCHVSALDSEGIARKLSWELTHPVTASRDKYYITTHIKPCHEQNIWSKRLSSVFWRFSAYQPRRNALPLQYRTHLDQPTRVKQGFFLCEHQKLDWDTNSLSQYTYVCLSSSALRALIL